MTKGKRRKEKKRSPGEESYSDFCKRFSESGLWVVYRIIAYKTQKGGEIETVVEEGSRRTKKAILSLYDRLSNTFQRSEFGFEHFLTKEEEEREKIL